MPAQGAYGMWAQVRMEERGRDMRRGLENYYTRNATLPVHADAEDTVDRLPPVSDALAYLMALSGKLPSTIVRRNRAPAIRGDVEYGEHSSPGGREEANDEQRLGGQPAATCASLSQRALIGNESTCKKL